MTHNDTHPQAAEHPTVTGHTRIVGVIGWPIEHTVSPPMHNAAFAALGMDWCYVPFPVRSERLAEAIAGVRGLGLCGINVTVPHKQAMLALMDDLTPAARTIGAVNTVLIEGDRLVGHNTDAGGFLRALREAGFAPEGCRAVMLGAGGAARAVGYALVDVGAHLTILNRSPERAVALATDLHAANENAIIDAGALTQSALRRASETTQLIVNATPLGMWPHVDASPWPDDVEYPAGAFTFDLIYNPRETLLMRRVREAGGEAIDGLGMLVHQGAEAFALWTGQEPPTDVMYRACTAILGGK